MVHVTLQPSPTHREYRRRAGPIALALACLAAAPASSPEPPSAGPGGPRRVALTLSGSLEESLARALPPAERELAAELTQVANRLLAWRLHVARDGRRGDTLVLLFTPAAGGETPGGQEPVIQALRYESQKLGEVVTAYRFHAPGARWARYYRPDGAELELRLADPPIPEYDQVTSLLEDGRHHAGIDFRAPVGTPVLATFDGVIERRNWKWRANGNCLDVRDPVTGRHALYLHLDALPREMVPGRRVRRGERLARSGNSGHSFAPHLHYQLEDAEQGILDPFRAQRVRRAALEPDARGAFDAARARLDAALAGDVPGTR
jgi:murein DD-endopeptidase